jgi:hypothetical protein
MYESNRGNIKKEYKNMYSSIKSDYLQLNGGYKFYSNTIHNKTSHISKPNIQTGGYITMGEALIDSILNIFNIKLFVNVIADKPNINNKIAYDYLAKFMMPTDKYQKYKINNTTYEKSYGAIYSYKTKVGEFYNKSEKIFTEIYSHLNSKVIASATRKHEMIRELATIFGKDFWKKISEINKDTLIKSIFFFYQDDLALSESDTLMIVDSNNYILYRNGEVDDTSIARYFEFDEEKFVTTEITDAIRINKLINYNKHKFILNTKNIHTSEVTLYDINTVYGYTTEAIRNLCMMNNISDEEKILIKTQQLLPNTVKFLGTLFNIKRGEFTNRNPIIYSMIFTNKLQLLLNLISSVLTDRIDLTTSNDVKIDDLMP